MKKGNKVFKKLMYITFCLVFVTALCVGCKKESTGEGEVTVAPTTVVTEAPTVEATEAPKEVTMTTGVYEVKFTPEGYSEFDNFIHFYDNGIFYLSLYNAGQVAAGYYEVVDQEMEYNSNPDDDTIKATAPQVVKLTNLDGTDYATIAYDQDTLMNASILYNMNFLHVADTDKTSADETGVTVGEFVLGDDAYSTVAIKHNGTFQDTISTMIDGTWSLDGNIYTLTDSSTNASYTLTISEDGKTGEYVGQDGTTQTLNMTQMKGNLVMTFSGTGTDAAGDVTATVECFDNAKTKVNLNVSGADIASAGTWVAAADASSTPTLTVNGTDYTTTANADGTYSFDFSVNNGTNDVAITLTSVVAQ